MSGGRTGNAAPLSGARKPLRRLIAAIKREPGITVDELRVITGWQGGQLNRYLVVLEAVEFCVRQKQYDKKNKRWVVCVRVVVRG